MPTQCLINLNARIYDPSIGRLLSADDIVSDAYDGQNYNRYAYVNNRPLSLTDPTGHEVDPDAWNNVACAMDKRCSNSDMFSDTAVTAELTRYINGAVNTNTKQPEQKAQQQGQNQADQTSGGTVGAQRPVLDSSGIVGGGSAAAENAKGDRVEQSGAGKSVLRDCGNDCYDVAARSTPPAPLPEAGGRPHSIVQEPGPEGRYTTYDEHGPLKQFRGDPGGRPHGGIERPNVKEWSRPTVDGNTRAGRPTVRPANPEEIPRSPTIVPPVLRPFFEPFMILPNPSVNRLLCSQNPRNCSAALDTNSTFAVQQLKPRITAKGGRKRSYGNG
jgi:RHS repeat-associated protein